MIIYINATVCTAINHGERNAFHDHLERAVERSLDGAWEGFELRLQELQKASGKRCFLDFASWIRPTGLAFFCPVPTNLSYCQRV